MRQTPRVAAIHDLSGFGRCSLTVVEPTLSAMGVQCCPAPTAYLSTHPGGFAGYRTWDMTPQLSATLDHWAALRLKFEGVYSGFLALPEQAQLCARAIEKLKAQGGAAVVDPVMGDHGKRYAVCSQELCRAQAWLCRSADVITPNLTEAALLLSGAPEEGENGGKAGLALAERLSKAFGCAVVLTGVTAAPDLLGAACCEGRGGRSYLVMEERAPGAYHGAGDLFAAVLTGGLVKGGTLEAAARRAARFTAQCIRHTAAQKTPEREGLDFEPLLQELAGEKDCQRDGCVLH